VNGDGYEDARLPLSEVWVLVDRADYEGDTLLGAYATLEDARRAVVGQRGIGPSGGRLIAHRVNVGVRPDARVCGGAELRRYPS
jgi:hypothetical protein